MLNQVVLIGRLVSDPELKYTPSGVAVATVRMAVDRPFKNAQGDREADFIDVVLWRQAAEFAANYTSKGNLVAVQGRLQIRSYKAQDNTNRKVAEVVADNFKNLSPRSNGNGNGNSAASAGQSEMEYPAEEGDVFAGAAIDE